VVVDIQVVADIQVAVVLLLMAEVAPEAEVQAVVGRLITLSLIFNTHLTKYWFSDIPNLFSFRYSRS